MKRTASVPRRPARQRGTALLSALIAFLVVSVGLLALTRGQSQLRLNGDLARQRSEAARLAQADIEGLRAFAALTGAGVSTWADIADATLDVTPAGSPTAYALSRHIVEASTGYKALRVTVAWTDRSGTAQQMRLATAIARHDPAYAGALTQPRHGRPVATVRGRDVRVPFAAVDLGDGRSALKLSSGGTRAVVFDNVGGGLTALCRVAAARRSVDLAATDLEDCEVRNSSSLVSGHVRFALVTSPSALDANDRPLPFDVAPSMADVRAAAPVCGSDAHDTGDGERWASYVCIVSATSATGEAVPGRTMVVPAGWTPGAVAGQYRVCRYATSTPSRQNFLVVAGPQACPSGSADGATDNATVAHQP